MSVNPRKYHCLFSANLSDNGKSKRDKAYQIKSKWIALKRHLIQVQKKPHLQQQNAPVNANCSKIYSPRHHELGFCGAPVSAAETRSEFLYDVSRSSTFSQIIITGRIFSTIPVCWLNWVILNHINMQRHEALAQANILTPLPLLCCGHQVIGIRFLKGKGRQGCLWRSSVPNLTKCHLNK